MPRGIRRQSLYLFGAMILLFLINLYFASEGEATVEEQMKYYPNMQKSESSEADPVPIEKEARKVKCSADGQQLTCLRDDADYYFPFNFLKKRFDISGHATDNDTFEWITSYARVKIPDFKAYNYTSEFGHFASYSVETRDRVRCINPDTGVPMSTQWDPTPYYYPIQIAQYGLQHYSRMVDEDRSEVRVAELGKEHRDWQGTASTVHQISIRTYFTDNETKTEYVNISSSSSLTNGGVYLYLKQDPDLHIVEFSWRPQANASFTLMLQVRETGAVILLNYVQTDDPRCVWADGVAAGEDRISFTYSLGDQADRWSNVSRDLQVDAARAMTSNGSGKKTDNIIYHPGDLKFISVGFRGEATLVQRIWQRTQVHRQLFHTAANWAVSQQDEKGGWPIPVERSIADRKLVLPPGWYSAMAQGHMISLLTRAWHDTRDENYLVSAVKALGLFEKLAQDGGVRNDFVGKLAWYEEYPTTPGSFVLNGFMYSLIGLYDLSSIPEQNFLNKTIADGIMKASHLYSTGMQSLLALLPLYDTGSGSIYDLRHLGLASAPNLARWDYHAVHVYLLQWLYLVSGEEQLAEIGQRWAGYARGNRAKHN
ncbi:unnamed protein product, partial [Mesorhabditis spiculigera]